TVQLTSMLGEPIPGAQVSLSATPPQANDGASTLTTMAKTKDGYQASLSLTGAGTWQLKAVVDAPGQSETSTTFSVSLPLPSAAQELAEVDAAMDHLTSLTEHNSLSNGQATVVTLFNYQAPDRLHYHLTAPGRNEESTIIGNTRYDRSGDGSWQASAYPNYKWPDFSYSPTASQVTLIGQQTIDGVLCDEITWYDAPSDAHFTIWAGQKDHLIRRLQMMATAHYMNVEYTGFNSSPNITAPKTNH
ncbi:MAG TPA: hypothetical protein VKU87_05455, partial [Thermomicrobiaceae bacterium]|nr:hypothetical protein [Thermomicrobiaceae bacterium]